jgi:hypothetical protein
MCAELSFTEHAVSGGFVDNTLLRQDGGDDFNPRARNQNDDINLQGLDAMMQADDEENDDNPGEEEDYNGYESSHSQEVGKNDDDSRLFQELQSSKQQNSTTSTEKAPTTSRLPQSSTGGTLASTAATSKRKSETLQDTDRVAYNDDEQDTQNVSSSSGVGLASLSQPHLTNKSTKKAPANATKKSIKTI